jgi:hypothetical protein
MKENVVCQFKRHGNLLTKSIKMKDLIKDIRESLEGFADDKRIEFAKKSYPTKMHVIGVTVPNLKIALKELSKQTKLFNNQEKLDLIKN